MSGYSWDNGSDGVDADGVVPDVAQIPRPVQAIAQERLTVGIVGDCPVTEWSVRAFDPSSITANGSEEGPVQELARESEAVGGPVLFRAPARDAVIMVVLRFGSQGQGQYYWLLNIGEYR
jgi:hypothetical protein